MPIVVNDKTGDECGVLIAGKNHELEAAIAGLCSWDFVKRCASAAEDSALQGMQKLLLRRKVC